MDNNVAQRRVVALPRRGKAPAKRPAHVEGIRRWHQSRPLVALVEDMRANPGFPCINGGVA